MTAAVSLSGERVLVDGAARPGWWVSMEDGIIAAVGPDAPAGTRRLRLPGADLIPGLVDLHSDCWEDRAHPRPTSPLPLADALLDLDAEVVAHGITTHFVCVALEDDAGKRRSVDRARQAVEVLAAERAHLRADHRVHLRVEVTGGRTEVAEELSRSGAVGLLSYMDHTPGQGQYPDVSDWLAFYLREGQSETEAADLLARRHAGQERAGEVREELAAVARRAGVVLVSHDDDDVATVDRAVALGAAIAEFPVNELAAKAAAAAGLSVVMGAPNARRGRSHLTNLSARQAAAGGCLHALASDYHPPSLLSAAYALADEGVCSWERAMALVSTNPAACSRLHDRGRLAPGARADVVAVGRRGGRPSVVQTWVAGRPAFGSPSEDEYVGGVL